MNAPAGLKTLNPAAGLRVLGLPFDHETTDALIGSYLSDEAAREDYQAALASGGYLHVAIVVRRDLDGDVTVELSDHLVREGAQGLGTLGLLAGLLALPLAPVVAGVGAAAGALLGEALHLLIGTQVQQKAGPSLPLGCAALFLAYPHTSAPMVEPAVTRAISKVVSQATGHHVQALRGALAGARKQMAVSAAAG